MILLFAFILSAFATDAIDHVTLGAFEGTRGWECREGLSLNAHDRLAADLRLPPAILDDLLARLKRTGLWPDAVGFAFGGTRRHLGHAGDKDLKIYVLFSQRTYERSRRAHFRVTASVPNPRWVSHFPPDELRERHGFAVHFAPFGFDFDTLPKPTEVTALRQTLLSAYRNKGPEALLTSEAFESIFAGIPEALRAGSRTIFLFREAVPEWLGWSEHVRSLGYGHVYVTNDALSLRAD